MIGAPTSAHLETTEHQVGKQNTRKIERKNLNLRT